MAAASRASIDDPFAFARGLGARLFQEPFGLVMGAIQFGILLVEQPLSFLADLGGLARLLAITCSRLFDGVKIGFQANCGEPSHCREDTERQKKSLGSTKRNSVPVSLENRCRRLAVDR
ncbi:MAG: hypothetical protein U1D30_04970 [Planctomycetota bacterium]